MTPLLVVWAGLPFLNDPSPGVLRSKRAARNLDCERYSAQTGSERYPGAIRPARARGDYVERDAVMCAERLMRPGLREARDEAILTELEPLSRDIVTKAVSLRTDLADRTWLVETYYPSGEVSSKISFATKNALMGQGLAVSDRVPVLGVGDVGVITRMDPDEAYPTACLRYAATGTLREGDALLAVVSRDARETILHGGLCVDGRWTWIP
ncbi:MAG: hypothetical protein R3F61_04120 [Myxococcota bacterium]